MKKTWSIILKVIIAVAGAVQDFMVLFISSRRNGERR